MTLGAFSQTASAQDKLSKVQLNTLISTAKTLAEHQRIADYYTAQAKDYLAQADEHKAMIVAYKANPSMPRAASPLLSKRFCLRPSGAPREAQYVTK